MTSELFWIQLIIIENRTKILYSSFPRLTEHQLIIHYFEQEFELAHLFF